MKSYTLRPDTVTHTELQCYTFRYVGMTAVFAGTKAERCRARDYLQVRVVRVDKYQVPHCWCNYHW